MATVELRFAALPGHVRTARLVAAAVGRRSGVPDILLDEVKLAVGEACSRAVSVHRRTAPDEPVRVALRDDDGIFVVQVVDCGPVGEEIPPVHPGGRASAPELLDPRQVRAPEAEAPSTLPAGLGLAIVEGLVDDVDVRPGRDGRGTEVTMRWPILPSAHTGGSAG
ncbi:MAG TPA: ATP-binding protein [Frankiaceae bacterium]|nr:ATP-binding protein [Frankiaceae bacterium]